MNRSPSRAPLAALACLLLVTSRAAAQSAPPPPAEPPSPEPAERPADKKEEDDDADLKEAMDEAEADEKAPAPSGQPAKPAEDEEMGDEEMTDAELEAELAAEQKASAARIGKPAPKGMGVVWGVVTDNERDTLPEAQVSVAGTKFKTLTDLDGRFRLELPPGTYTVRVYFEMHRPTLVKNVIVTEGEIVQEDVELQPDEAAVDVVEIQADADRSTIEGQLLTRQRSAAVGDGVGRAEMSRTPASNAAQAAQRVVGATIVANRFVYVRGLGERYTNALLNGASLPSPEPDRAAIPLDLFPSLILESVNIVKTFTPDVPGDFAGGSVRINTRELPSKPLFQVGIGAGYDTNSTFRDRLAHKGSSTDFLGFDHSTRALPDGFPSYVLLPGDPKPNGTPITDQDVLAAGQLMNSSMAPEREFTLPNYSLSAVGGNGWAFSGEQRLGVLASINYSRSFTLRDEIKLRTFGPSLATDANGVEHTVIQAEKDLRAEQGNDKVSWGSLGSVSYWPNQWHRFTLLGMHTQLADATSQLTQGFHEDRAADIANGTLRYVSRALNFLQLRGDHTFNELHKAELNWNAAYSVAIRDEPDTRNTVYQFNVEQNAWNAVPTPENGSHLFATQDEKAYGGGLDWTQPLLSDPEALKAKVGGLVSIKDRHFVARRFTYARAPGSPLDLFSCPGPEYAIECPNELYLYDNIGPVLSFSEETFPSDAYDAELNIYAGYGMLDANISSVRLIGGARVERTDQSISPFSQFSSGGAPAGATIDSTDVLPSISAIWSTTKKTKLRAAFSQTIARPQIRELSPFVYTDYFGARPVAGNPLLKLTYINNYDLRFEAFPTGSEVLAMSFFYKTFEDPIEPVVTGNNLTSYQNSKGATLEGIELEARKGLGFVSEALKEFSLIGNLTLAYSQIELDRFLSVGQQRIAVTTLDRPMVNQAPYVVNFSLDYDNDQHKVGVRLLYNLIGPRIVEVGTAGLDDAYEQPRHGVDLTASKGFGEHFQVKVNATNLLDSPVRVTVGEDNDDDLVMVEYREGRIFTLSGSYTY